MSQETDSDLLRRSRDLAEAGTPAAVVTIVRGDGVGRKILVTGSVVEGSFGDEALDAAAVDVARARLDDGASGLVALTGTVDAFVDIHRPRPLLVLIGAVHVAQVLLTFAQPLGFRTVVADARESLANRDRFPTVDQLLVAWPDDALAQLPITSSTAIVILTHDPKFDEPAITGALASPAGYIGAIGSRKTSAERRDRLQESGIPQDQVDRIHAPIGLDIGGRSPEEMAISILGEIIAERNGRGGGSLRASSGRIRAGE
jgi:xanthine dehydrogenase accessory factor